LLLEIRFPKTGSDIRNRKF